MASDVTSLTAGSQVSSEMSSKGADWSNMLKDQREYAWNYFQIHASQRMSAFNFFIVIAALLTTGLAGTFVKDFDWNIVGTVLGLGLMVVSFAFWKLDQRVRFLIQHAESFLKEIEQKWRDQMSPDVALFANLFSEEEFKTNKEREREDLHFWARHLSYSDCFEIVYCLFTFLGFLGAVGSFLR